MHNPHESNQNLGNRLGERPCVGQNRYSREQDSGNTMKGILGYGNLSWDTNQSQGAFAGQGANGPRGMQPAAELTAKVGGGRANGFVSAKLAKNRADVTGKIGGPAVSEEFGSENSNPAYYAEAAAPPQQQEQHSFGLPSAQRKTRGGVQERGTNGNPLSWDSSDQWQTTSSQTGSFYRGGR